MFNKQQQRGAAQSIFMSSIKGFANTAAVAATFFSAPPLYSRTVDWVTAFTTRYYGSDLTDIAGFAWFVIVTFLVFFTARASISTLLVVGGLAVAVRFL